MSVFSGVQPMCSRTTFTDAYVIGIVNFYRRRSVLTSLVVEISPVAGLTDKRYIRLIPDRCGQWAELSEFV